jgi:DNA-binding response OmpR family regulator
LIAPSDEDDMKPTILVIEDDPIAANLVNLILSRAGYKVLVAFDGLEGLQIAASESVDLVLLDLMLPGIDGFEVLTRLRADPQTAALPVVIISVKTQIADRRAAAKVGADAYLTKPYNTDDLVATVDSLLQRGAEDTAPQSRCMMAVGPHRKDVARAVLHVGLALNDTGVPVTVVDLHPLSSEHSALLGLPAHPAPIALADPANTGRLADLPVQHSSGLRLLNNLQGRGQAGQLTSKDMEILLDALSAQDACILIDLPPDYPTEVLCRAANHCALVLLIARNDSDSLQGVHAVLTLMQRSGVEEGRIAVVIVGPAAKQELPQSDQKTLYLIQAEATPDHPVYRELAARLREAAREAGI